MTATAVLVEQVSRLGDPLSVRELQVVSLVADGLTNADIGRELWLSSRTVQTHLRRVAAKLGMGDRAGIVGATFASGQLRLVRSGDVELEDRLTAVLVRVARGMSNAEIGRDLFVSEHSVKSRMQAIFDELGVRDRAAAVRAGLECGAISLVPRGRLRAFPGATSDRAGVAGPVEALAASQTQSGTAGMRQAATGALRALPAASAPDAQVPR